MSASIWVIISALVKELDSIAFSSLSNCEVGFILGTGVCSDFIVIGFRELAQTECQVAYPDKPGSHTQPDQPVLELVLIVTSFHGDKYNV